MSDDIAILLGGNLVIVIDEDEDEDEEICTYLRRIRTYLAVLNVASHMRRNQ